MIPNNKYFTAAEIYVRLLSSFPKKGTEISKINVMRWCSEVVTELLTDPVGMVLNSKIQLGNFEDGVYKIVDGKVEVPVDCFKLEAVYDETKKLSKGFSYQGQYIHLNSNYKPEKILIDYYSLPVGEDGFPLIKRGYESACYAYSVYKMFEEDASAIPPRIQQWRWYQICEDKEHELSAAYASWSDLTDNDIRDIHNFIIDPNYIRIINKFSGGEILNGSNC